tara:strand:- start:23 stop:445 length:423 start_codon:yes stop_codon:yes gene_type:complete
MIKKSFSIFCDGGSRGNPGPAAIGFAIKDSQNKILGQVGKTIGRATNNVAEYTAVVEALKWLVNKKMTGNSYQFFLDSKLVVNQLNGRFKVKDSKLRDLIIKVRQQEQAVGGNVFYHFIPREKNSLADSLVNIGFGKDLL